jgi:pseudaminic acid cytidylyltransferase
MKPIAIITARGGSKRIPKKNIRDFCGKPILAYSIEAALQSELFDEVMVSTESEEIAEIARQYGASVPFLRSAENANDYSDTCDVLLEVLNGYKIRGKAYKEYCCIYPTAPFVTAKKLQESYCLLQKENVYNVVPMVAFSFPPQRAMVERDGMMQPARPELIDMRSQDLEPLYHDCGQFYWGKVSAFFKNQNVLFNHTLPYFVSELEAQDIDNESDWALAEAKYCLMKGQL